MNTIKEVVEKRLCIGCGLCTFSAAVEKTVHHDRYGQSVPLLTEQNGDDEVASRVCPGKGYGIVSEGQRLFDAPHRMVELGSFYNHYAAFAHDDDLKENASSGGMMSQIASHLLDHGLVAGVLVTSYHYTENGPRTKSYLAKSKAEIINAQGSKYCPVDLSGALAEIRACDGKVAVIGTPCQIAGIRNIQRLDQSLAERIVITISNFCGGIKSYHNISTLAKRNGIRPQEITFFRFRGGGQPGSLVMAAGGSRQVVRIPYPKYVGLTGFSKHLRCHLCVDATGELADISCGDAWLPRFLEDGHSWSLVITRSRQGDDLIKSLVDSNAITAMPVSADEVIMSQRENLTSKKIRQKSRMYLYKKLGYGVPVFDGGFVDNDLDLFTELKVFLKHRVKLLLELSNLYGVIYGFYRSKRGRYTDSRSQVKE